MGNKNEDYAALDRELAVADGIMLMILDAARTLTPEGWERAWSHALINRRWHTNDAALIKDVRLISMRGGPRYKPLVVAHTVDGSTIAPTD